MTPTTRLHLYELYHAWRDCYHESPSVDDLLPLTVEPVRWPYGYPRGQAYACLWRLGLL